MYEMLAVRFGGAGRWPLLMLNMTNLTVFHSCCCAYSLIAVASWFNVRVISTILSNYQQGSQQALFSQYLFIDGKREAIVAPAKQVFR